MQAIENNLEVPEVPVQQAFRQVPNLMAQEVSKHVPRVQVQQVEKILGPPPKSRRLRIS